jgi:1,4-alpha-glucan branching enzyme
MMKRHHNRRPGCKPSGPTASENLPREEETVRIELKCDAPGAEKVYVAGDFNNWRAGDLRLRRDSTGPWQIALSLAPGRYEYRFIVDGEWQDDPDAMARVPNEFGSNNSVLEVHTERLITAS